MATTQPNYPCAGADHETAAAAQRWVLNAFGKRRPAASAMPRITLIMLLIAACFSAAYAAGQELLSKYELQVNRFGPVTVGMAPNEASKTLGIPLTMDSPPDEDDSSCHYVYPDGKSDDIGFMVEGGRISRIDIYSKTIAATGAIHVGDDESLVKKAYPGKVKEEIHPYIGKDGKYLTVEVKPGYAYVFETDRGRITTFRAGKLASVQYIEGCL